MRAIHRLVGYVILNTDAIEIIVAICGLLIVWIVGTAMEKKEIMSAEHIKKSSGAPVAAYK